MISLSRAFAVLTATCLLLAAPTSAQTEPTAFYHLRAVYTSTSDWAEFTLGDARSLLTYRIISVEGEPERIDLRDSRRVGIYQPLERAEADNRLRLTVDYALDAGIPQTSLPITFERGAFGTSEVEAAFVHADGSIQPLATVRHEQIVAGNPDRNPVDASLDLSALANIVPEPIVLPTSPDLPPLLWAVYYLWYTPEFWSAYQPFDQPAQPYTTNIDSMRHHITEAQSAGIDGFLASWWGPNNEIDAHFARLLDLAQAADFRIGLYFESLGDGGQARSPAQILDWLRYALGAYSDHPAWMKIDGKPIIVFWATDSLPLTTWASIFETLRAEGFDLVTLGMGLSAANLYAFDGAYEYGVVGRADLAQTYADLRRLTHYAPLLDPSGRPHIWMATAQPGYDERGIPEREGRVVTRDQGATYTETFAAAVASAPDWIMITSWNEWPEHTYVEPSQNYADSYLRLTQEWARIWRTQNEDGS